MKQVNVMVTVLAVLALSYIALLSYDFFQVVTGPPAPIQTSLVLDYRGRVNGQDIPVRVRVYKIEKWSTASDMDDIFNSKIEIDKGAGHVAFVWPQRDQFYATSAAVRDLDADGSKELVLDDQGTAVRVLFFEEESLRFRQKIDELTSLSHGVGPVLVNGRSIFVRHIAFPHEGAADYVHLARLHAWNREKGFQDVTHDLRTYYKKQIIPRLSETMQTQTDSKRHVLYEAAIDAVKKELSK